MATVSELTAALDPVVSGLGYEVDDIVLTSAGRKRVLEVIVDSDNPVDLNALSNITRAVSNFLDESQIMGELPYLLEVSSRGVSRPLTKPVHWKRNLGRLVEVRGDAVNLTGRITSFQDPIATIDVDGSAKEVDINSLSRAIIQVEFKKLDKEEKE